MNKHFETTNDADYIKKSARLIEFTLETLGFKTRVCEVNILDKFHEYYLEVGVGTNLKDLEKHDRDLALVLPSPTGKVYWQIPVPGKSYIGLRVPKPSKKYFEDIKFKELINSKSKTLLSKIAYVFFLFGEANYYIASQILDRDEVNTTKHTKLFYRAIARIKAVNEKNGAVLIDRIRTSFKVGPIRAYKLQEELVNAGVLRWWNERNFKKTPKGEKFSGNIIWKNLNKYKIPKEILKEETSKVVEERKKGLFPKTIGDLNK